MADVLVVLSYFYLGAVVAALVYRGYGVVGRMLAGLVAKKVLRHYGVSKDEQSLDDIFGTEASKIFLDRKIEDEEFSRFAEISLSAYIMEDKKAIDSLLKISEEQDSQIRILGYLLQKSLRDRSYLESLVVRMEADSKGGIVAELLMRSFARRRLESYAIEMASKINRDFSSLPARVRDVTLSSQLSNLK